MNNDNDQNNTEQTQNALSEGLSALTDYYLPDGMLMKSIELFAKMKDNVMELDSTLVNLAKTSGLSASELKQLTEEAFRMGDAFGRTGTEALSYITSASEAGYDMQQSLALAGEALKMSGISSGIDSAGDAIAYLQTLLGNLREHTVFASTINDSLAGAAKHGSTDFDTLAQGALTLSASADAAGISFAEMLGLLSGAYDVLKDMDQVAGGEIAIFSKLRETHGEARNVFDVLSELNGVWDSLDAPSKDAFASSTVGDGQKEVFAALMDNWAGVESAVASALNSFGAAEQANADYLDSLAGRTAVFQNKVEQLSAALMDSDLLKFFLDLGSTGVGALNSVSEKISALGSLGAIAGGIMSFKNLGRANHTVVPL